MLVLQKCWFPHCRRHWLGVAIGPFWVADNTTAAFIKQRAAPSEPSQRSRVAQESQTLRGPTSTGWNIIYIFKSVDICLDVIVVCDLFYTAFFFL